MNIILSLLMRPRVAAVAGVSLIALVGAGYIYLKGKADAREKALVAMYKGEIKALKFHNDYLLQMNKLHQDVNRAHLSRAKSDRSKLSELAKEKNDAIAKISEVRNACMDRASTGRLRGFFNNTEAAARAGASGHSK